MSDADDRDDLLESWILSEAPSRAPSRLRDAVRHDVARIDQVGSTWPSRLLDATRTPARGLATFGVVCLMVVTVGWMLFRPFAANPGNGSTPGRPLPTASASPNASAASTPSVSPSVAPTPRGTVLQQGPFRSTRLVPAITTSVPSGWTLQHDGLDQLVLVPPDAGWLLQEDGLAVFDSVSVYARPTAGQPDGSRQPVPDVGTGPEDLAVWLSTRPQLNATSPVPKMLAGRTAWMIDFTLASEAGDLCGVPCAHLLNGPGGTSYGFGIVAEEAVRAYFLEAPNGDTVMVVLEDADASGLEMQAEAAAGLLDSLAFDE